MFLIFTIIEYSLLLFSSSRYPSSIRHGVLPPKWHLRPLQPMHSDLHLPLVSSRRGHHGHLLFRPQQVLSPWSQEHQDA